MASYSSSDFVSLFALLAFISCLPICVDSRGGERVYPGSTDRGQEQFSRHLLTHEKSEELNVPPGYKTNSELEEAMRETTHRCQNISVMYSIGTSVKGTPLWVLEFSDNPGQAEPEPAFKFVGNVHGDEPVGRELLLFLSNWLCDNYGKDPLASLIIKNTHLHILPTMNPDGFALRRRGNANNVDLNRDFPDQFVPQNDDYSRQSETKAIMNWLKTKHFTASASLHGGALVANYPWDGSKEFRKEYFACPDDEAFQYMASLYSNFHYNMSKSHEFQGGITNGAAWYPIYGGMQDWNYIHGGCFELTLEISDIKWPRAEELLILWDFNKASMLNLVASLSKSGVHGRIFSAHTGKPLSASVDVKGINYTACSYMRGHVPLNWFYQCCTCFNCIHLLFGACMVLANAHMQKSTRENSIFIFSSRKKE